MSSEAQTAANRANAQLSTGPQTEEGKAIAARNSSRHGLTGRFFLGSESEEAAYDRLLTSFIYAYTPFGVAEQECVVLMAQARFQVQRAHFEQQFLLSKHLRAEDEKRFALFLRYQAMHERHYWTAYRQLQALQKQEQTRRIGSVSQQRKQALSEAAETRRSELHNLHKQHKQGTIALQTARLDRLVTPKPAPASAKSAPEAHPQAA